MLIEKANIINRKVILLQKGYSMRSAAKAINYTPAAVSFAINKCQQSKKMHIALAALLEVSLAIYWPELYSEIPAENVSGCSSVINQSSQLV